jgi:tetratricopeptide (TPR) repeat protein
MGRAGFSWSGREKKVALLNTGNGSSAPRFADISALSGFNFAGDGRALAIVDWDGDGDMDVWAMNRTGPQLRFFENNTRRAAEGGNAFVTLELTGDGKKCSRDAIGARAEIVASGPAGPLPRLVRSLAAGDTHNSQSTRRMHFGLGQWSARHRIEKLIVRWPDSETRTFTGLQTNHHYQLSRGGQPVAHALPKQPPAQSPAPAATPSLTNRAVYSNRLPPPALEWNGLTNGAAGNLDSLKGKPVVLIIWASWCPNCRREWQQLAGAGAGLKNIDARIVALNLDAASKESGGDIEKAKAFWNSLGPAISSVECAEASPDLMRRLEQFRASLHWIAGPLNIPGAFFFDSEGRLAVHSEGTLSPESLRECITVTALPQDRWVDAAMPFPGRRYGRIAPLSPASVPQHLIEDGAVELAAEYLKLRRPLLDAAWQQRPDAVYPRALYSLGVAQGRAGNDAAAMESYRRVLELQHNHVNARYNLASILTKLSRRPEATHEYELLTANVPAFAPAFHNLALLKQESGNLEGAAADYQTALRLAPENPDTLNNLGNVLVALKRPDEAVPLFQTVLTARPDDARTHYNLGIAFEDQIQWKDAAAEYQRAITLDPRNAQYHHNLGVLMAKQSRWADAETSLLRCLELNPQHPTAQRNLDRVRQMRGGK